MSTETDRCVASFVGLAAFIAERNRRLDSRQRPCPSFNLRGKRNHEDEDAQEAAQTQAQAEDHSRNYRPARQRPARALALLTSRRGWRACQLRPGYRRLADPVDGCQGRKFPAHCMDAARTYAHCAMGHPRIQPESEIQGSQLARRLLAEVRCTSQ